MAKKSSLFGLGTVLAAVTGAVAGAVGVFLSDEDNRKKVASEVKHVERVVEKDIRVAKRKVKKVASRAKKAKRKSR